MRKLASVVEIATCDPIENSDRLSVATMVGKGWRVVTSRDEFKPGDLCVYFEIDSALPADDSRYEFLRERCLRKFVTKSGNVLKEVLRIKTVKLRGVISQGLLMPLSAFVGKDKEIQERIEPATQENCVAEDGKPLTADDLKGLTVSTLTAKVLHAGTADCEAWKETIEVASGSDLTSLLHVEHYDEVAEALRPATGGNPLSADAMGKFPTDFIPKTDEERIQNLADFFTTMPKDKTFEITEKNDGSSVTMFYSKRIDAENPFGVCSRNLRLKPQTAAGVVPLAWQIAAKYDAESQIKAKCERIGCELAFQGELVGPGVNGNRDLYKDHEWHVFKIYDVTNGMYLPPCAVRDICKECGFTHVPVIEEECKVFERFHSVDELLKFAEGKTAAGHEREGLVFKSCDLPMVSFKAVSNRYLLKQE